MGLGFRLRVIQAEFHQQHGWASFCRDTESLLQGGGPAGRGAWSVVASGDIYRRPELGVRVVYASTSFHQHTCDPQAATL